MKHVVDTNVLVVAEGAAPQASRECLSRCAQRLRRFTRDEDILVLDEAREILREYQRAVPQTGQPGVGRAFLKWVLTNWANPGRCELVAVERHAAQYAAFPSDPGLSGFHDDDHVFVALALSHRERPSGPGGG